MSSEFLVPNNVYSGSYLGTVVIIEYTCTLAPWNTNRVVLLLATNILRHVFSSYRGLEGGAAQTTPNIKLYPTAALGS